MWARGRIVALVRLVVVWNSSDTVPALPVEEERLSASSIPWMVRLTVVILITPPVPESRPPVALIPPVIFAVVALMWIAPPLETKDGDE